MKIVFYIPTHTLPGATEARAALFREWTMRTLHAVYSSSEITIACVERYANQREPSYYVEGGGDLINEGVGEFLNSLWDKFTNGAEPTKRQQCAYCGKWGNV